MDGSFPQSMTPKSASINHLNLTSLVNFARNNSINMSVCYFFQTLTLHFVTKPLGFLMKFEQLAPGAFCSSDRPTLAGFGRSENVKGKDLFEEQFQILVLIFINNTCIVHHVVSFIPISRRGEIQAPDLTVNELWSVSQNCC